MADRAVPASPEQRTTMTRGEKAVLWVALMGTAMLVAAACARSARLAAVARRLDDQRKAVALHVSPAVAIGERPSYKGDAKGQYVLVEFMDYQCPPCKAAAHDLPGLVDRLQPQLRLTVRQFPLVNMHMLAMDAAITSEAAREQGKFWEMHDALMACNGAPDVSAIDEVARKASLDLPQFTHSRRTSARAAVRADLDAAAKLGLPGTPSFVLCCPDGRVVRLGSLGQLTTYVHPR